jgi:hypothetical protein
VNDLLYVGRTGVEGFVNWPVTTYVSANRNCCRRRNFNVHGQPEEMLRRAGGSATAYWLAQLALKL